MAKLFGWFKDNKFAFFTLALLVFIPLYPKLPLVDIFGTWVYIRLDDVLVSLGVFFLVLQYFKKKKIFKTSLTTPIVTYWVVGLVSLLVSLFFIGPKLAGFFPHIAILHYLRRIEYMSVFFIAYFASCDRKFLVRSIWAISITAVIVVVYGLGQKLYGWPAFLTMNEEFAKGVPLRLPSTARMPSTFAGHYDLAAYLVLIIPIFGSLIFSVKKIFLKLTFLIIATSSLGMLLLTASRVSFGVYLVSITVMLVWRKKWVWIVPVIIASFYMLSMVSSASERFFKTLRFTDVIVDLSTGQPIGTLDKLEGESVTIENQETPDKENLPKGSEFIGVGAADTQKAKPIKTVEYFTSKDLATGSGEIATISGSFLIQKAFVYDISITTRFQGQWPKAIEAFKRNILTGSGFSTLSIASDGDYLRMLGETGVLGTIGFLGIFLVSFLLFINQKNKLSRLEKGFVVGVFAGVVGLMLNAVLIDVFEASKVAYCLWLLMGISIALLDVKKPKLGSYFTILKKALTHPFSFILYFFIFVFILWQKVLSGYFIGDDFTWLKWAASGTFFDIGEFFTESEGFFWRPIPKLFYFLMYQVFWLKSGSYHFISLVLYALSSIFVYLTMIKINIRKLYSFIFSILFISLSVHHENIFWISGYSSLLASLFYFSGLYFMILSWKSKKASLFKYLPGIILISLSMLSYDPLVMAPFSVWIVGSFLYKKNWFKSSWILLLSFIYWYFRGKVSAVEPAGDYGVNTGKLTVNLIGNTAGYISAFFFGPKAVEWFILLRNNLKHNLGSIKTFSIVIFAGLLAVYVKYFRSLTKYKESLVWAFGGLALLVPYLGLGNISERYLFTASGLFCISIASLVNSLSHNKVTKIKLISIIIVVVGVIWWNLTEINRISSDWKKASNISEQTLLKLRNEFFPLQEHYVFIFVDTPIRIGRAWIFPTGLDDALWHLFRLNGYNFKAINMQNVKDAFKYQNPPKVSRQIFLFEDYKIKRAIKEVKVVE
ncbi:hypothetical protein ACFL1A_01105 [Patescibacteria group bacterium]